MKILLIEDDQPTSEFLSATLSSHRYAVDAIADGSVGLALATQWNYDLILLDVLLPTLNGIEVCRCLRAQDCQTPILMLTVKDSSEDIVAGLDAGADDYLPKSSDPSQLLARVRALLRRSSRGAFTFILTWGSLCLDPVSARVTYQHRVIALRPKEYSLLELFLRHPKRVFSRSAIIDHLWAMDDTPVEGSVTNLIKDLRQRLKTAGMETDLIETVYGLGYRLKPKPSDEANFQTITDAEVVAGYALATDRESDWDRRTLQGITTIQNIAKRFRLSLEQRIAVLESVERSLQAGDLSTNQRDVARKEAHKLSGGLGTFGYGQASKIAEAIEDLLASHLNREPGMVNQFSHLLAALKQELAEPLTNVPM
ncbi:response regulator with CheY-like receiver domain and winged-helix DNA-binding domain [Leptolyngbyaceae cyanobacterium JSC-12]|nr:response regulator with CheY-like receiver domain and winged-helix DNA-binding domain [Leptolyngbyaceae cyanobacterium JSC-12]